VEDFDVVPARRGADALVDVCRFYLDHRDDVPTRRHRPHLNVVVDYNAVVEGRGGRVVGGGFLDGAGLRRLLCDSGVHRVVTDGRSSVLDYGTTTRTVPAALWNALVLRDEHCRQPGCDRPAHWCEAHHVVPWQEGGATSLDNLVLKCTRHHHVGHLPGWREKLEPSGALVVTDPQGRTRTTHPPGPVEPMLANPRAA
jgi:5-methylcytosine-specific restriction protein A